MKALSVKQPWAHALIYLGKSLENRDWQYQPKYRGPLLIHASKAFDREGYSWIVRNHKLLGIPDIDQIPMAGTYPCGGIVGIVDLTGVVTHSDSPWFSGPLGLVVANPQPIEIIPYRGQLGIFEVPDEILKGRI